MPLTKLQFRPGIDRDTTSYSNEGGWYDCDKIRFRGGFPEKIRGWERLGSATYLGSCRSLHQWRTLSLSNYMGMGTSTKYYVEYGDSFYDITPIRRTTGAGDVTFAAVDGSSTLTITDIGHGAVVGDYVTFSDAVSLGGSITADVLNQEYQIDSVVDEDTYTVIAREVATLSEITVNGQYTPTPVLADASDIGDGGAGTIGAYQINIGLDTSVFGNGWGAGSWGRGAWGSAADVNVQSGTLRLWMPDNFGEDLIFNSMNGGIYYWDSSAGLNSRAVYLNELPGSDAAPTVARQVMVSDADRHVIAFGCDAIDNPGVQDELLIRFSSQESATDWRPTATNTAGDLIIGSGSRIIRAVETRQQILVFTDVSLHAMQFLGPPFTFGLSKISEKITIQGPNAVKAIDDRVFWMGARDFYVYEGTVVKLPCTVLDYVFDNFNYSQSEKVFAANNASNNEIWWFYPSADSNDIDRYVVFNYIEKVWYFGTLSRTAWVDRGATSAPIAAGSGNRLYNQETGFDDGSTVPPSPITAYIRSSPMDITDGEEFVFISRMIPDVGFRDSSADIPSVDVTTRVRNHSGGAYLRSTTSTVTDDTELVNLRLRGRQFSILVQSDDTGVSWRLGTMRYDIRPDGKR